MNDIQIPLLPGLDQQLHNAIGYIFAAGVLFIGTFIVCMGVLDHVLLRYDKDAGRKAIQIGFVTAATARCFSCLVFTHLFLYCLLCVC